MSHFSSLHTRCACIIFLYLPLWRRRCKTDLLGNFRSPHCTCVMSSPTYPLPEKPMQNQPISHCLLRHEGMHCPLYVLWREAWRNSIPVYIVSWEPEGHYHYSKMFSWEPEGCCHHKLCTAIAPFRFSMEHLWMIIAPFWLSTDDKVDVMWKSFDNSIILFTVHG